LDKHNNRRIGAEADRVGTAVRGCFSFNAGILALALGVAQPGR